MQYHSIQKFIPILGLALMSVVTLPANHPVLVEGNCNNPPPDNTSTVAGTCGDFDGDGRIGVEEDTDGDRVFGTIAAANGSAGANNNGTITIVTSGTFPELVSLSGNITLQAAPGVHATIDAVLQGESGSGARQGMTGITVDAPASRFVVIRNLQLENWTVGMQINGASRVLIEDCRVAHTTNYGILATGSANVMIDNTSVMAIGRRLNPGTGDFPGGMSPTPGTGIEFQDSSTAMISNSRVMGSVDAGIANRTSGPQKAVTVSNSTVFGNGRDYVRSFVAAGAP